MIKVEMLPQTLHLRPLAVLVMGVFSLSAFAQGVATDRELTPVMVSGTRAPLDPNLPASTFSTTRESLAEQSFINTEDALAYAPSTTVRKRFIGDRNANLGGRSFGTTQPARGLAYVDGYLISNFLGRFDAPRWSSVATEEIGRVDVLYGPFSAIYPGNSIGTTVAITTRNPKEFEASGRVQYYSQRHKDYGFSGTYNNDQESAYVGARFGNLSLSGTVSRLAYESHPMTYATMNPGSTGTNLGAVSGATIDADPTGQRRVVMGATGMQQGVQEQAKLKLVYDFSPTLQADGFVLQWRNDYKVKNQSLLRSTTTGAEVWKPAGNAFVNFNGVNYQLPTMAPQEGEEQHLQYGGRLRTRHKTGWNYSVQASQYSVQDSTLRQASNSDPSAVGGTAGTDTLGDGTGWRTFELQSTYTPGQGENHALTFGFHQNDYTLENRQYRLTNWKSESARLDMNNNYYGKTRLQALYAQDAWRFLPDWTATVGLRLERFESYDGSQYDRQGTAATRQVNYDDRQIYGASPKLSLSRVLSDEWLVRASYGRGVRFPTVSELFLGSRNTTTNIVYRNDAGLRPEINDAKELSFIREVANSNLRVTLFEDDVKDAIFQQTLVGAGVSTIQNVDRVRTRGVETAFQGTDVLIRGFDLQGSLTLAQSQILENKAASATEGNKWPRVPRVRASLFGTYRLGGFSASLGMRHEGRQYNSLDNSDGNPNTYGGVSSFTVADARVAYRFGKWGSVAVGMDNLTDKRYYVFHPYPGRTTYLEARLSY
ncbi:MAG: TonB-dependent receptor [Dechloromonas sp.]|nr:TonB-dependent receptor [Dechloromonas sp.]